MWVNARAESRADGHLASYILAQPGADDVSEDDLFDLIGRNFRSINGRFGNGAAQDRGGHRFKSAAKSTDGCAD